MLWAVTRAQINLDDFKANQKAIIGLDDLAPTQVGPQLFRKRVARYGSWHHKNAPDGLLTIDKTYAQQLADNFSQGVWPDVAVTFGHPKDEADAVKQSTGKVVGVEVAEDGYYNLVQVTAETAQKIKDGAILQCSMGIIPDYEEHEVGGRGKVGPVQNHLALTNEPYIKNLGDWLPVQMADAQDVVVLSEYEAPKEAPMNEAELIAAAKELKLDPAKLATDLGLDIAAIETAARDKALADVATLVPAKPDPKGEAKPEAAKTEATKELVAALGEALASGGVITLAEGQEPTLADVVGAITTAVQSGKQANITLAEQQADAAVAKAIREGKALPAQAASLKKVWLSDKETFEALLPKSPIVDFNEIGSQDQTDLSDPATATGGINASEEIDRYAKLAETMV